LARLPPITQFTCQVTGAACITSVEGSQSPRKHALKPINVTTSYSCQPRHRDVRCQELTDDDIPSLNYNATI